MKTRNIVILVSVLFCSVALYNLIWFQGRRSPPRKVHVINLAPPRDPHLPPMHGGNSSVTAAASAVKPQRSSSSAAVAKGRISPSPASTAASVKELPGLVTGGASGGERRAASYRKPVVIAIVTGHYLGNYGYRTSEKNICKLDNVELDCNMESNRALADKADALWCVRVHVGDGHMTWHDPVHVARPR